MTRDYSQFLPPAQGATPHARELTPLETLGWQPFFAQQTDTEEMAATPPVRISEIHRSGLHVIGDGFTAVIPPGIDATVGDWVMYDAVAPRSSRILDRKSVVKRRAAGHDRTVQLIASNIDTVFVVSSCNADFNVARLERYVALAFEAEITPVILLTKIDLCDDSDAYVAQAQTISDLVEVLAMDARGGDPVPALAKWCKPSQTVAFLGSSGVGKSTLTNALIGRQDVATQPVREDDARGRHTTTYRHLHILPNGVAVLDTPGMRELQLTDAAAGDVFADLEELATGCRFRDCGHDTEPGCAVRAGIAAGDVDPVRLERWRKLAAEDAFNTATLAQRKAKDRTFGKMIKHVQKKNKKRK
jgi:ribosome biogenesis GTPase